MVYITGDTHGDLSRVIEYSNKLSLTSDDVIIILGDVGLNYYGGKKDQKIKLRCSKNIVPTLFCIHGNHEKNPEYMHGMSTKIWNCGEVYYEDEYPNILYAKDGEIYDIDGKKTVTLGGAYSVDKYYRLAQGFKWFSDEQMTDKVKLRCENNLAGCDWNVDIVLSHTVPFNYMPVDMFIPIDQRFVDDSMEKWLQKIHDNLKYNHWYAGHFHCNRTVDKVTIMFEDWMAL